MAYIQAFGLEGGRLLEGNVAKDQLSHRCSTEFRRPSCPEPSDTQLLLPLAVVKGSKQMSGLQFGRPDSTCRCRGFQVRRAQSTLNPCTRVNLKHVPGKLRPLRHEDGDGGKWLARHFGRARLACKGCESWFVQRTKALHGGICGIGVLKSRGWIHSGDLHFAVASRVTMEELTRTPFRMGLAGQISAWGRLAAG